MPRGRKPKPRNLKLHDGNPGKRPIGEEPQTANLTGPPPRSLGPGGRTLWTTAVDAWGAIGVLQETDRVVLHTACELRDEVDQYTTIINEPDFEPYQQSHRGGLMLHPAIRQRVATRTLLLRFLSELGMTPTSRVRLGSPTPGNAVDELDAFARSRSST